MPHKDTNQEPAVEPIAKPESGTTAQPPARPAPRPPRRMAKVLERAIAPDLVPPAVKRGDLQIDTGAFIAEFADIARHQGPWASGSTVYAWLNPQET